MNNEIRDIHLNDRVKERYCKKFERIFYFNTDTGCCWSKPPTLEDWIKENETRFLVKRYTLVKSPLTSESYPALEKTYMILCNQLGRLPYR